MLRHAIIELSNLPPFSPCFENFNPSPSETVEMFRKRQKFVAAFEFSRKKIDLISKQRFAEF